MSIPEQLWKKCVEFIMSEKGRFYRNPTDFIIDAVRRELRSNSRC